MTEEDLANVQAYKNMYDWDNELQQAAEKIKHILP